MRGELKRVSSLFEKYKKTLVAPESSVIEVFLEVLDDVLGIRIEKSKVRYVPGTKTLSIQGLGSLRSEIKMHEKEIMNHLKGRLGEKSAPKKIL